MKSSNLKLSQGVTFKIVTDYGISDEDYQKCLNAIADILLTNNDYVINKHVGHYDKNLNQRYEVYKKDNDMEIIYQ